MSPSHAEALKPCFAQPGTGQFFEATPPWRDEGDTPIPLLLAPRRDAIAALAARVRREGMVFAYGATGMGKSLLVRMTARTLGPNWMVADFKRPGPRPNG